MPFAYAFEAKSIQSWILAGGKLRDIAGASHLLDRLCAPDGDQDKTRDVLQDVLDCAAPASPVIVARRAGGALTLCHDDKAPLARIRALWRAEFAVRAPGLDFVDALSAGGDIAEAIEQARQDMAAAAIPAPAPLAANPFTMRDPRTGGAAVDLCKITGAPVDAGIAAKRKVINRREEARSKIDPLGAKFALSDTAILWPTEMEASKSNTSGKDSVTFPFAGENRTVGVMHADGNGLGLALTALSGRLKANKIADERYAMAFERFSAALAVATRAAVADATRIAIIEPHGVKPPGLLDKGRAPARPILLGGDDVTIILRGDVALPFTKAFLQAFEERTAKAFEDLNKDPLFDGVLPKRFSAGAGIVFIGATQPFTQACALAEDVAKAAKTKAKTWALSEDVANAAKASVDTADAKDKTPAPSLIGFTRVTGAAIPETLDAVERELTTEPKPGLLLAAGPYHVSGGGEDIFPSLDSLTKLAIALRQPGIGKGAVRRMNAAFFDGAWQSDWDRILSVTHQTNKAEAEVFCAALTALGCKGSADAPSPVRDAPFECDAERVKNSTPLLDALSIIAASRRVGGPPESSPAPKIDHEDQGATP